MAEVEPKALSPGDPKYVPVADGGDPAVPLDATFLNMLILLNIMLDLRNRRQNLALSQADLSAASGISRTSLSFIENGLQVPSADTREALERVLNPFAEPVFLQCGRGVADATDAVKAVAARKDLPYALTLDVAAWIRTKYQTPAAVWAYVRPLAVWRRALRAKGAVPPEAGERANLVLLRAPDDVLSDSQVTQGLCLVSLSRLVEDSARMGGRHGLDAARVFVEFPESRRPGMRIDGHAMLKVLEEAAPWT